MGRERQQDPIRFTREIPVKDLGPKIIEDLSDILTKWGTVTADDAMVRFHSGPLVAGIELFISGSTNPKKTTLIVAKSSIPKGGMVIIRTNQGEILWDKELKSYEAELAIALIDERAKKAGLLDELGNRLPIKPEQSIGKPGKYHVDEVFAQTGSAFLVLPDQDPDTILNQFDKPEELYISYGPLGGATIVHSRDRSYHARRREVAFEVLRENGIDETNLEESISDLSLEEVMALREEIEKRLKKED